MAESSAAAPPPPSLGLAPPLIPERHGTPPGPPAGAPRARARRRLWPHTLALAAALSAISFYASGGLSLPTMTATEMAVTAVSGLTLAAVALWARGRTTRAGLWPALLLLGFALLSGLSIVWSVQPDYSWRDADRLLAYAALFGAAVVTVRFARSRWPAVLGAIAISSVVVCGYALLTKCLPDHFVEANRFARLYEPYGYWNALGLTAAMGAIACMWLGARRAGHALLNALAYPAMGLLLLTLLLAYSRGALLALGIGALLWFSLVPLRLRGASVLLSGAVCAGAIAAWDFSDHALSSEGVPLAETTTAGHELGALTLAMVVLLSVVGLAVTFLTGRTPPPARARRRAGTALLAAIALAVLAFLGALAHSHRGFTGSISHALHTLTDTHATVPNTPGRLTAVASVRAQYWRDAIKVFEAHPWLGSGAEGYKVARLRYRTTAIVVRHAHGFLVQTLADLGIAGLALALALLAAWMAAAGRATHPFNRRWRSWRELRAARRPAWLALGPAEARAYTPERIGLLSMLCVVVAFGVHSLVDWTWYVPGNAMVALICAGWLAGRGPLRAAAGESELRLDLSGWRELPRLGPTRLVAAAAAIVAAGLIAWSQWQPLRSEDAQREALALAASNPSGAVAAAHRAVSRDPLSAEALFTLADVQNAAGEREAARATLSKAVREQPSNPLTWLELGRFDLPSDPRAALSELRAAIYLDPESIAPEQLTPGHPESIQIYNDYLEALRRSSTLTSGSGQPARAASGGTRAARLLLAPRSRRRRSLQATR